MSESFLLEFVDFDKGSQDGKTFSLVFEPDGASISDRVQNGHKSPVSPSSAVFWTKKAPAMCPGLSSSCRETPTLAKGGLPLRKRRHRQKNLIRASVLPRSRERNRHPSGARPSLFHVGSFLVPSNREGCVGVSVRRGVWRGGHKGRP